MVILFRDLHRSKWEEGGRKWLRTGNEKTHGKYIGEIENGVPNGKGNLSYPDGSEYVGEFNDGNFWNISRYDKNGNNIEKYVNGNRIKQ